MRTPGCGRIGTWRWRRSAHADVALRAGEDVTREDFHHNSYGQEYADAALRADRDIVLEAVREDCIGLEYTDA